MSEPAMRSIAPGEASAIRITGGRHCPPSRDLNHSTACLEGLHQCRDQGVLLMAMAEPSIRTFAPTEDSAVVVHGHRVGSPAHHMCDALPVEDTHRSRDRLVAACGDPLFLRQFLIRPMSQSALTSIAEGPHLSMKILAVLDQYGRVPGPP